MTRVLRFDVLLVVSVLLIGGLIGLLKAGEESGHPTVGSDLEPLRAAFNVGPQHVRAILLASPT